MAIVITPDDKVRCMGCGKAPAKPVSYSGPYDAGSHPNHERWHCYNFGCRHGQEEDGHEFFACLPCFLYTQSLRGCPKCGNQEELC